jgi:hypothetical protein
MNHQFKFFSYIALFSFVVCAGVADAATLSVTPGSASVNQGSTFSVTVRTDTKGASVNVAEATVSYPADKLEVVSAAAGTTFPLQTPGSPKKSTGQVFFSGGVPSGYVGTNGVVGRITFRAKISGSATIAIAGGRVLLNDGNATDALTSSSGSTITIKAVVPVESESVETTPEPVAEVVPITPEVIPVVVPEEQQVSDVVPTTIIRTEDLINLIYVLVGLIVVLLVIIVILIVMLMRRRPQIVARKVSTPRRTSLNTPLSVTTLPENKEVPKLSKAPRRKPRSIEPI